MRSTQGKEAFGILVCVVLAAAMIGGGLVSASTVAADPGSGAGDTLELPVQFYDFNEDDIFFEFLNKNMDFMGQGDSKVPGSTDGRGLLRPTLDPATHQPVFTDAAITYAAEQMKQALTEEPLGSRTVAGYHPKDTDLDKNGIYETLYRYFMNAGKLHGVDDAVKDQRNQPIAVDGLVVDALGTNDVAPTWNANGLKTVVVDKHYLATSDYGNVWQQDGDGVKGYRTDVSLQSGEFRVDASANYRFNLYGIDKSGSSGSMKVAISDQDGTPITLYADAGHNTEKNSADSGSDFYFTTPANATGIKITFTPQNIDTAQNQTVKVTAPSLYKLAGGADTQGAMIYQQMVGAGDRYYYNGKNDFIGTDVVKNFDAWSAVDAENPGKHLSVTNENGLTHVGSLVWESEGGSGLVRVLVDGGTDQGQIVVPDLTRDFQFDPGTTYEVSYKVPLKNDADGHSPADVSVYYNGRELDKTDASAESNPGDVDESRKFHFTVPKDAAVNAKGKATVTFHISGQRDGQQIANLQYTQEPTFRFGRTTNADGSVTVDDNTYMGSLDEAKDWFATHKTWNLSSGENVANAIKTMAKENHIFTIYDYVYFMMNSFFRGTSAGDASKKVVTEYNKLVLKNDYWGTDGNGRVAMTFKARANEHTYVKYDQDGKQLVYQPSTDSDHTGYTDRNGLFAVDGLGYGEQTNNEDTETGGHNFHYSMKSAGTFTYHATDNTDEQQFFHFLGDDDTWLFINGKLAIDLGGAHTSEDQELRLDGATARDLGLKDGETYRFDFFYMERNTKYSNFTVQTNIKVEPDAPGTLSVVKNVPYEHQHGEDAITRNDEFRFDVALRDSAAGAGHPADFSGDRVIGIYKYDEKSKEWVSENATQTIHFSPGTGDNSGWYVSDTPLKLKHNERAYVIGMDDALRYSNAGDDIQFKIAEHQTATVNGQSKSFADLHWHTSATSSNGDTFTGPNTTGTVDPEASTIVTYTNQYDVNATADTDDLFRKVIVGTDGNARDWKDNDSFDFKLTPVKLDHGKPYKVNAKGEVVTDGSGSWATDATAPMPEVDVKAGAGDQKDADGNKLDYNGNVVTEERDTVTVDKNTAQEFDKSKKFGFGTITFWYHNMSDVKDGTATKTFTYAVDEVVPQDAAAAPGVTYDASTKLLKITVKYNNNDDSLTVENVEPAKDATSSDDNTFTNRSALDYEAAGGLSISKILTGKDMTAGQFGFTVTPRDWDNGKTGDERVSVSADQAQHKLGINPQGDHYLTGNAKAGKASVINLLEGSDPVIFTKDDAGKTYVYLVRESKPNAEDIAKDKEITYDTAVRRVSITTGYAQDTNILTVTTTVETLDETDANKVTDATKVTDAQTFTYSSSAATAESAKAVVPFVNHYGIGLKINKVYVSGKDSSGKEVTSPQSGARFMLTKGTFDGNGDFTATTGDAAFSSIVETGKNGVAAFDSLADGTYRIEETWVPAGFSKHGDMKLEISTDSNGTKTATFTNSTVAKHDTQTSKLALDDGYFTITLENTSAILDLPQSGGTGDMPLFAIGMLLMAGAVALAAGLRTSKAPRHRG